MFFGVFHSGVIGIGRASLSLLEAPLELTVKLYLGWSVVVPEFAIETTAV